MSEVESSPETSQEHSSAASGTTVAGRIVGRSVDGTLVSAARNCVCHSSVLAGLPSTEVVALLRGLGLPHMWPQESHEPLLPWNVPPLPLEGCRSAQSQSWLRSVASGRPVIGKPSCSCGMSAVGRSVPVANAGNTTPKIVRRLLAFENHGPIDKTRPGPVVASAAKQPVTPTFQVPLIGNRPLEVT